MAVFWNGHRQGEQTGGGGTGRTGPRGARGYAADVLRWIFIAASSPPATPTGGARTGRELTTLPGGGWTASPPSTLAAGQQIYACLVTLSGQRATTPPTYGTPGIWSGPRSPYRVFIYRVTTTTLSATPTGGSFDDTTFNLPANWLAKPPATVAPGSTLYIDEVVLTPGNRTPSYSPPVPFASPPLFNYSVTGTGNWHGIPEPTDRYFRVKVLGVWTHALHFGADGADGTKVQLLYQRSSDDMQPAIPTGGTVTNGVYTPPVNGAWELSEPSGSEPLYISFVFVNPNNNTASFGDVLLISGRDGTDGDPGLSADRVIPIFQRNTAIPTSAPSGTGTWDGTTFTPESGWQEAAPSPTQTEYVVMQWCKLTQSSPYTLAYIGVPQLSSLKLPASEPAPTQQTYLFSYGLAGAAPNYPVLPKTFDAQNPQPSLTLAVGEEGTLNIIFGPNTVSHPNYFFDLPTGVSLVSVHNTGIGSSLDTDSWTVADSHHPNRRFNTRYRPGGQYHARIVVRRTT